MLIKKLRVSDKNWQQEWNSSKVKTLYNENNKIAANKSNITIDYINFKNKTSVLYGVIQVYLALKMITALFIPTVIL